MEMSEQLHSLTALAPDPRLVGGWVGPRDGLVVWPLPGIETQFLCHSTHSLVAIPTELSQMFL
jgi:hypothetical protein